MSRSYSIILIAFGWLLCGLSGSRSPCGHQRECVPNELCRKKDMSESDSCQRAETCCHTSQVFSVGAPLHCGHSYPDGLYGQEKVAENQAQSHEFPWIVALFERNNFLGGGSLVTENCVLTAAHLLVNKTRESLLVKAGIWDLTAINSRYAEQRTVARIELHSEFKYSEASRANNLALIVLESSFQAKPHIGFICQPSPEATFDHQRCLVSGWGTPTQGNNDLSSRPKRVSLPIVDRATCQARLRRTRLGREYELHPSVICAGGEKDRDACQGDGGSPLMCPIAGHPTQYGLGCGQPGVPGICTSVSQLKPWIDDVLNDDINAPFRCDNVALNKIRIKCILKFSGKVLSTELPCSALTPMWIKD